jgi:hypothetical protein
MQYFTGALIPVQYRFLPVPVPAPVPVNHSTHSAAPTAAGRPLVRLAPAPRDATLGPATVPL